MNLDHPAIQRCLVADSGDIHSARLRSDPQHPQTVALFFGPLVCFCEHGQSTVAGPCGLVGGQTDTPPQLATENHARAYQNVSVY